MIKRKRILAWILSVVMIFTLMPVSVFASGTDTDQGNVREEALEETVETGDDLSETSGVEESEVIAEAEEPEETAEGDGDEPEDEKTKAEKFIEDNYLGETLNTAQGRFINNGGDAVVRRDTDTYFVGLRTTSSQITTLRFNKASTNEAGYKYGFFSSDENYVSITNHHGGTASSVPSNIVKRPAYEEGDKSVIITLKLYPSETANADINSDTAEALASHDFTIILEKDVKKYYVTINPIDRQTQEAVTGASVSVYNYDNGYNNGSPDSADGVYSLVAGSKYHIVISHDLYLSYDAVFTADETSCGSGVYTAEMTPIETYTVIIKPVDSKTGEAVDGAVITVYSGTSSYSQSTLVSPIEEGGTSYKMAADKYYRIAVSADGYESYNETGIQLTESGDYEAKMIKIDSYTITIKPVDSKTGEVIEGANIQLRSGTSQGSQYTAETPDEDGTYTVGSNYWYRVSVTADGYIDYDNTGIKFTESGEYTAEVTPIEYFAIKVNLIDAKTKEAAEGAGAITVTSGTSSYSQYTAVEIDENNTFQAANNLYYKVVVADSANYRGAAVSGQMFTEAGDLTIEVTPIISHQIDFSIKDSLGNTADDASIAVYLRSYGTDMVEPIDGKWALEEGQTYYYLITHWSKTSTSRISFVVGTEDQTIDAVVSQNRQKLGFTVTDTEGNPIEDAVITLTGVDEYYEEETDLTPDSDGYYLVQKYGYDYCNYTVKKDGYTEAAGRVTPDFKSFILNTEVSLASNIDPADVEKVEAAVKAYNDEYGALRPGFAAGDTNIAAFEKTRLAASNEEFKDIEVTLKSSDEPDWIAADGTINYNKGELNAYGMNSKNVSVVFTFSLNGAAADTGSRTATIGWDQTYYTGKMQAEADLLETAAILGANASADEITSDLTLPQIMSSSARTSWGQITWTSSDDSIIKIEDGDQYNALTTPKRGVVTAPAEDTKITLTAVFTPIESNLNTNVEKVSEFTPVAKTFEVTVKGSGQTPVTEEELLEILNRYLPDSTLTYFNVSDGELDLLSVHGDIQLPRYTRIKDEDGNLVFANKEITFASDNEAAVVNGFRLAIDQFTDEPDVKLTVSFTREEITVSRDIILKIENITDAALDAEIAMMETAKGSYWDGLNDGTYADKDSVTGNLHAFQEMTLDEEGNAVFAYTVQDKTDTGIIPDSYWGPDQSEEMKASGYNRFRSSNVSVIQHENLVVVRPEASTQATITSWLSSAKYGSYAVKYPDNEKLQKLYKQEVSVTVTVKGTKEAADALNDLITEAEGFAETITEGEGSGEYPEGTKAALEEAIAEAKAAAEKEDLTEAEAEAALADLQKAIDEAKAVQNPVNARVDFTSQLSGGFLHAPQFGYEVAEDLSESYGFEDSVEGVSVLDVLVAAHELVYGEDFTKDTASEYLAISGGSPTKQFGIGMSDYFGGFYYNHAMANDGTKYDDHNWNGTVVGTQPVKDGDLVEFFFYEDPYYGDTYNWFVDEDGRYSRTFEICESEDLKLMLRGFYAMSASACKDEEELINFEGAYDVADAQIYTVDAASGALTPIEGAVTDEDGTVTLNFAEPGTYTIAAYGTEDCMFTQLLTLTTVNVKAHEHDFVKTDAKAATCTDPGNIEYWTCSGCGKIFSDEAGKTEITPEDTVVPAAGHDYDKKGYCKVCGEFIFTDIEGNKSKKYVSWAYENEIVKGMGDNTFAPNEGCSRIQFVMMLWKMHGSPTVKGTNPFSDIEGSKTTKAILWALDKEVINPADKFNPDDEISRIQIVMILWKLAGSPTEKGTIPFTDIEGKKTTRAVLWAYNHEIVKGMTDTTFEPDQAITRLQLVIVLNKYNEEYKVI